MHDDEHSGLGAEAQQDESCFVLGVITIVDDERQKKAVRASSNVTPCFRASATAFAGFHSKRIAGMTSVGTMYLRKTTELPRSEAARSPSPYGVRPCGRPIGERPREEALRHE